MDIIEEYSRALYLMNIEKTCVTRRSKNICDADCEKCDLVQKDADLIGAYTFVCDVMQRDLSWIKSHETGT